MLLGDLVTGDKAGASATARGFDDKINPMPDGLCRDVPTPGGGLRRSQPRRPWHVAEDQVAVRGGEEFQIRRAKMTKLADRGWLHKRGDRRFTARP
ncbi:hypothetical protein [Streptomyces regalis]|uniref:Uncharacterized protein n=1 Tax=Streptomyces regalis TaxID=68262 RepID=A0A0X3VER9_9ACTN|nr:hypothetical protein [Streptomyces regalis]KUL42752.1 hypothetical protein ADL12_08870 [Streptomyces regalis]